MIKQSAGILLYRIQKNIQEFFLVHPGGPFWKDKDIGSWSIPKGEFTNREKALNAAVREFEEETGIKVGGKFIELTPVKLKSGKIVYAWALEANIDLPINCKSFVDVEWPPKSGKKISIPEVDKGGWFSADVAKQKINSSQAPLIDELIDKSELKKT